MPTFRRTEVVDARQFTGGQKQGADLVFWVLSNEGRAMWYPEREVAGKTLSERIVLVNTEDGNRDLVWVNDWIIHHQDGSWSSIRPEDLKEQYEEV